MPQMKNQNNIYKIINTSYTLNKLNKPIAKKSLHNSKHSSTYNN